MLHTHLFALAPEFFIALFKILCAFCFCPECICRVNIIWKAVTRSEPLISVGLRCHIYTVAATVYRVTSTDTCPSHVRDLTLSIHQFVDMGTASLWIIASPLDPVHMANARRVQAVPCLRVGLPQSCANISALAKSRRLPPQLLYTRFRHLSIT